MNQKPGLTKREMLALLVLIIIAALCLHVALNQTRTAHGHSTDLNNLLNLGQAMCAYQADHKDMLPARTATDDEVWPQQLHREYVKDWGYFRSPYDKVTPTRPRSRETAPQPISYGLNFALLGTSASQWNSPPYELILIAPAVDVKAIGREVKFCADAISINNVTIQPNGPGEKLGTHQNREAINVVFADGSVQTMDWKKFSDNQSARGKARWEPNLKP